MQSYYIYISYVFTVKKNNQQKMAGVDLLTFKQAGEDMTGEINTGAINTNNLGTNNIADVIIPKKLPIIEDQSIADLNPEHLVPLLQSLEKLLNEIPTVPMRPLFNFKNDQNDHNQLIRHIRDLTARLSEDNLQVPIKERENLHEVVRDTTTSMVQSLSQQLPPPIPPQPPNVQQPFVHPFMQQAFIQPIQPYYPYCIPPPILQYPTVSPSPPPLTPTPTNPSPIASSSAPSAPPYMTQA